MAKRRGTGQRVAPQRPENRGLGPPAHLHANGSQQTRRSCKGLPELKALACSHPPPRNRGAEITQPAWWQGRHDLGPLGGPGELGRPCPPHLAPGLARGRRNGRVAANRMLQGGGISDMGICSSHRHLVNAFGARAHSRSPVRPPLRPQTSVAPLHREPWTPGAWLPRAHATRRR